MERTFCVAAALVLVLSGCGSDVFTGDDGAAPDASDATVLDAAPDVAAETGQDAPGVPDVIDENDKDAPACADPCALCAQSSCGLAPVVCLLDATCAGIINTFYACRCAGMGSTCNPAVMNSSDTLVDVTFANCIKSSCTVCGF